MSERRSKPAPPSESDGTDDSSFIERWSRRKAEARQVDPEGAAAEDDSAVAAEPRAEPVNDAVRLSDEDMPPLGELDQDSDYSPFLAAGVSPTLRQKALRQLFRSAKFNVVDGLDDYCEDLTSFEPLGDIVTADMKARAEALMRETLTGTAPRDRATGETDSSETGETSERMADAGDSTQDGGKTRAVDADSSGNHEHDDV